MTAAFNCPTCGAPLDYSGEGDTAVPGGTIRCPYCNNSVVVPADLRPQTAQASAGTGDFKLDTSSLLHEAQELKEVVQLARGGSEIEAIKRYREITGVGLADAKAAVDSIRAGNPITLHQTFTQVQSPPTQASGMTPELLARIKQLAAAGQKIEAIKLYRESTSLGLVEAKNAVEALTPGAQQGVPAVEPKKNYLASIGVGLFLLAIASIFPIVFIPMGITSIQNHDIGGAIGSFIGAGIWALIWGGIGLYIMFS